MPAFRAFGAIGVVVAAVQIGIFQLRAEPPVPVLTVCEVLANYERYANRAIAVVGRMKHSVGIIDHYEFLAQDGCEHPVITNGHRWKDEITIWSTREKGMPKPPAERPRLDPAAVRAKLSLVQKTTRLGFHEEPRVITEPSTKVLTVQVPNEWAVLYGAIVIDPNLNKDCGIGGCGGFDVPLIVMVKPYNITKLAGFNRR